MKKVLKLFSLIFNQMKLVVELNQTKHQLEIITDNFMKSSYKHVLNFERQQRQLEDLTSENLELKGKLAEFQGDKTKVRAVEGLKKRRAIKP